MKVLLTGGYGFLGNEVYNQLAKVNESRHWQNQIDIIRFSRNDLSSQVDGYLINKYDLTKEEDVKTLYEWAQPDVVIHMAATVGGIGINREKPGTFYYDNMLMGLLAIEYARKYNVKKFVSIGTICAYPKHTPVPFKEEDLWNGYPEETNAPYGLAKKMLLVQSQAYRQQFGMNCIYLLPVNLYGPGDNFDPKSSHVIPALIKKFEEAQINNLQEVEVWGSGEATREFLYVTDAAEAIINATINYDDPEPMNIGSGIEISIKELAIKIAELIGYTGRIRWNTDYPDGQPRRCLDVSKARAKIGFIAKTDINQGLLNTIKYYRELNAH